MLQLIHYSERALDAHPLLAVAVNTLLSVTISWGIAHIYFKKVTPAEIFSDQIRRGMQLSLIPALYPEFFFGGATEVKPMIGVPANEDVPHVQFARFPANGLHLGGSVDFLLKVRDTGSDLRNPEGIKMLGPSGEVLQLTPLGLGYCMSRITLPNEMVNAPFCVTIRLIDEGGRVGADTLRLPIGEDGRNG